MKLAKKLILLLILGVILVNSSILKVNEIQRKIVAGKEKTPGIQNKKSNGANPSERGNGNKFGLDWTFDDFKQNFGKIYRNQREELQRRENFVKSLKKLAEVDCSPCGVTIFFDKSQTQLKIREISQKDEVIESNIEKIPEELFVSGRKLQSAPTAFDWREYGVVTSIKNQGDCGSCWAFTATAFLQGEAIRRGYMTNTTDLSNHFIYQCTNSSNFRCNGGSTSKAVTYGIRRGMPVDSAYPYQIGYDYPTACSAPNVTISFPSPPGLVSGLYGFSRLYLKSTRASDETMISYLLQRPIYIGVDASDMYFYAPDLSAPFSDRILSCSEEYSGATWNHGVLLVGYTADAWIIKNSWGPEWGDNGYVYVTRNTSRNCGIGFYYGTLLFGDLAPVV